MVDLRERRILLGVTGSVAAFKAAALASELTQAGAHVRTILTESAGRFITPETFQGLTGEPVLTSLWREGQSGFDHIALAKWAEVLAVVPASAGTLARLALGLADDLLTTVALAFDGTILLAPAMESSMFHHPATQSHLHTLRSRGAVVVGPESGRLASGESGAGRLAEPDLIAMSIAQALTSRSKLDMQGMRLLVTAGPTREPIDPVRYISNRSSGKMGFAIARQAASRGASVTLIAGPVEETICAAGLRRVDVETAAEMSAAVTRAVGEVDVLVMAAAVADYRPVSPASRKLKKSDQDLSLHLAPTADILTALDKEQPRGLIRIGFAAETDDLIDNARGKLASKNLDLVVANDVSGRAGAVFGSDDNSVVILRREGHPVELPRMPKQAVADRILDEIVQIARSRKPEGEGSEP